MIKLTVKLHSQEAVEEATKFTNNLKIKNLRGVRVSQEEAKPVEGTLDMGEYLPYIKLIIESGLATAALTQLVGLLKNGFFTTSKQIKADTLIKNKEIEAQQKQVEFNFECKDKKFNLKFTKDDSEQKILETINNLMEKHCD